MFLSDFSPVRHQKSACKQLNVLHMEHFRPLQFAYQQQVGVDNAIIYLLQKTHSHLDQNNTIVRITFFDFSSAFNTIQPLMLGEKMDKMQVDKSMIGQPVW